MLLLYSALALLLFCGIGLLTIPFIQTSSALGKSFFAFLIFFILFSLTLYLTTNHQPALKQWLTQGKQHYQLQEQVERLGGFAGMIRRIKQKLAANPNDAEGWFILGKLYLADGEYNLAEEALKKAKILRPYDLLIERYYEKATTRVMPERF